MYIFSIYWCTFFHSLNKQISFCLSFNVSFVNIWIDKSHFCLPIDVHFWTNFFVLYIHIISRQSAAGWPIAEVRFNGCVVCHYCEKKYLVRTIDNHWRYCEAYINQCLGCDETKGWNKRRRGGINVPRGTIRATEALIYICFAIAPMIVNCPD